MPGGERDIAGAFVEIEGHWHLSDELTTLVRETNTGTHPLVVGRWAYTVNLDAMTQANDNTGKARRILNIPFFAPPVWLFEDGARGSKKWVLCNQQICSALANAELRDHATVRLVVGSPPKQYEFDLRASTQRNTATGYVRPLRRLGGKSREEPLRAFLLSNAASRGGEVSLGGASDANGEEAILSDDQIRAVLHAMRDEGGTPLDQVLYRDGRTPAVVFLCGTYRQGLALFKDNERMARYTRDAMRFVLHRLYPALLTTPHGASGGPSAGAARPLSQLERLSSLRRLVEAFTKCQAVQASVLNDLYGQLSGRDASLRDAAWVLVDRHKRQTLDRLLARHGTTNPHLKSAWLVAFGSALGLPDMANAQADEKRLRPLSFEEARALEDEFRALYEVDELVRWFVHDANQRGDVERFITQRQLTDWAHQEAQERGFDAHSIYFDAEERDYGGDKPPSGTEFEPFLCYSVALEILCRLFLPCHLFLPWPLPRGSSADVELG